MREPHTLWCVFWVSCGLLAYEIGLMRVLLYASWHHFAFLVLSVALLGFGMSGSLLSFVPSRGIEAAAAQLPWLAGTVALSLPAAFLLAQRVPVESQFIPALFMEQAAAWTLQWTLLGLPFLAGAGVIAVAISAAGSRAPTVYAVNLLGSACGALAITWTMSSIDPARLPIVAAAFVLVGGIAARGRRTWRVVAFVVSVAFLIGAWQAATVRMDPFKYESYIERLARAGDARLLQRSFSPRAVVAAYEGSAFHTLPFLAPHISPPSMTALVLDGHSAGAMMNVEDLHEAVAVDSTLTALAYAVAPERPRVLLLGEATGVNVWLARRQRAADITVIQPNQALIDLATGPLANHGGHVFRGSDVSVIAADPRHFVDVTRFTYDVIQVSALESWAVSGGGLGGIQQDDLVTVEGLASCLDRLSPDGILLVARGLQLPPRDNAKLAGTLIEALESRGTADALDHVVMVRDFLASLTVVKRSPWTPEDVRVIRRLCGERQLTPVHYPGIQDHELNHPDALPGPQNERGDWLHHAVRALGGPDRERFISEWAFDIRPATDDRPFFSNFTHLGTVGRLRELHGDAWMTRTELGRVFVIAAVVVVGAVALAFLLVPALLARPIRRSGASSTTRATTATYFVAIGLGYLTLEIAVLSRVTRLVGDPVVAGAVTIGTFLFFSGTGSLVAQRVRHPSRTTMAWAAAAVAATTLLAALALPWILRAATLHAVWRAAIAVGLMAPLAFSLGFPMPLALRRLMGGSSSLVPFAWAANGFASVLAPPVATAVAMAWGFGVTGLGALACYALAVWTFPSDSGSPPSHRSAIGQ